MKFFSLSHFQIFPPSPHGAELKEIEIGDGLLSTNHYPILHFLFHFIRSSNNFDACVKKFPIYFSRKSENQKPFSRYKTSNSFVASIRHLHFSTVGIDFWLDRAADQNLYYSYRRQISCIPLWSYNLRFSTSGACSRPTIFPILESKNPPISQFYVPQIRWSTGFEALIL